MNRLIGSDIEYAPFNLSTSTYEPAGVLPIRGKKGRPTPLKHGGVEIDCCGVEITPKPASNADEWVENILGLKQEVETIYPSHSLRCIPEIHFESEVLRATRYANTMGCSEDFNAWTEHQNPAPNAQRAGTLRTFGGHVHIEGGSPTTVVACDIILGLWSAAVDKNDRRQLYGKAGAFRPKPYGVEYRVLSNFWCDDEARLRYVYESANYCRTLDVNGVRSALKRMGMTAEDMQTVINTNNLSTKDYERLLLLSFPEHMKFYEKVA